MEDCVVVFKFLQLLGLHAQNQQWRNCYFMSVISTSKGHLYNCSFNHDQNGLIEEGEKEKEEDQNEFKSCMSKMCCSHSQEGHLQSK